MKQKLFLFDSNNKKWIAGTYYIRNIAFQLIQNEYILDNYDINIITSRDSKGVFEDLQNIINVVTLYKSENSKIKKMIYAYTRSNAIFYPSSLQSSLMNTKAIQWIPDFQHCYYPEFFSDFEIERRNNEIKSILNDNIPIVLSSYSALSDFKQFFVLDGYNVNNVAVVPFVSYLLPLLNSIDSYKEQEVMKKYGLLHKKYACVMNQFWKHKNHKIVLEAIKKIGNDINEFSIVFTGELNDYRNDEHIESIKLLFENPIIKEKTKLLGFIDRISQIVIMKNAQFIIQPSLFEGWGTVVEDAKVLDKKIILSNIPIHQEQKNDKCILFDPSDADELADLIYKESLSVPQENIENGILDMKRRAKDYSKGFEILLRNFEKRR